MAPAHDLAAFFGKAGQHFNDARPLMPMYAHLIVSALFPIYVGAHASLSRPSSAAKAKKKTHKADGEEEDEDTVQKMEGLSNKDAIILPITAGLTLGTIYFLIKKYGADVINLVMGVYFAFVGVFSVAQFVNDATNVLVGLVFPTYFQHKGSLMRVSPSERRAVDQNHGNAAEHDVVKPVPWLSSRLPRWLLSRIWDVRQLLKQKFTVKAFIRKVLELDLNMTLVNVFAALTGLGTTIYASTIERTWFLTNLQGFAVSYSALQILSPTTFTTGSLVLIALFFYDIWAVFFTPLMIGVATKLDQPIKLVFPKPDEPSVTPGEPPVKSYSMLGLGDIVVPGIMIGLALRFDLYMFYLKKQRKQNSKRKSTSCASSEESVKKAPYVPVTGRWGDRLWTLLLPHSSLPANLHTSFPKPYFTAAMTGYVTGMLATLGIMTVFQHAQPALLYLVPGVLISLWGTALVRGEAKKMWEFSEGIDGSQVDQEAAKEDAATEEKTNEDSKGLFERLWAEIKGSSGDGNTDQPKKSSEADKASTPRGPRKSDKAKSPTRSKKADAAEKSKSKADDALLFSFSISLFDPKSASVSKAAKSSSVKASASKESPAASSDSSDDAIVVSSADLDGTIETESTPRYRTRSLRGVSRGRP